MNPEVDTGVATRTTIIEAAMEANGKETLKEDPMKAVPTLKADTEEDIRGEAATREEASTGHEASTEVVEVVTEREDTEEATIEVAAGQAFTRASQKLALAQPLADREMKQRPRLPTWLQEASKSSSLEPRNKRMLLLATLSPRGLLLARHLFTQKRKVVSVEVTVEAKEALGEAIEETEVEGEKVEPTSNLKENSGQANEI
jgi:hypothetical protein